MPGAYGPETYGNRWSAIYDSWVEDVGPGAETGPTVEFLASVAGGGPALELGIGTGRVALPLAGRGIEVHGVDASPDMVAELRGKPGGDRIPVTIGDFASVPVEGRYSLIFVVFNTFFALLTQDDQVNCFAEVAGRLGPGGVFVLAAFLPNLARFDGDQRVDATLVAVDRVMLTAATHDAVTQVVTASQVVITQEGTRIYPVRLRYAWPSELDLMARLAGMRLRERFGGWGREPFTAGSGGHVSVYEPDSA